MTDMYEVLISQCNDQFTSEFVEIFKINSDTNMSITYKTFIKTSQTYLQK